MNIGITLLYTEIEKSIVGVYLKSYVIQCDNKSQLNATITSLLSKCESWANYSNLTYQGVYDVFSVSGAATVGEMLGRTTYEEVKNTLSAKSLIREVAVLNTAEDKIFTASLIYFNNQNSDYTDERFALTTLTLVNGESLEEIYNKCKIIGLSNDFKSKIVESSVDEIKEENIDFIGVERINKIPGEFYKTGAFEVLYNDGYGSISEIKQVLLLSEERLTEMLRDIGLRN